MNNSLFSLEGKNCLITGGAGLLGRYHAEAIIEAGGNVFIADILEDDAKMLALELCEKYNTKNATGVFMNVLDELSISNAISEIKKVDILINNAAKDPKIKKENNTTKDFTRFENMSIEGWKAGLDVSLNGTFLVTQAVINNMLETDTEGVILNIASDLGVIAPDQRIYRKDTESFETQSVKPIFYSASKWAMIGMTKYLATYFAEKNIRVNSVSPGGAFNNHPDDFVKKVSNLIPMKRMANIDEYKGTIIFACSNASSYMTGQNIIVDGGRSVW